MKKFMAALFSLFFTAAAFAYNPPAGGHNFLRITSPELINGGRSSAGGASKFVAADSIIINPALTAFCKRPSFQAAGTILFNENEFDKKNDNDFGGGFEIGTVIPTQAIVASFIFQGIWVPFDYEMDIENNTAFTLGLSKDFTDNLSFGISGNLAFFNGNKTSDWSLTASIGLFYNLGDVLFLKKLRLGFVVSNLGRIYEEASTMGIDYRSGGNWPGSANPRVGMAGTLFKNRYFDVGLSFDLAFPAFQNFVFDSGLNIGIMDFATIKVAWEADYEEIDHGRENILPSVGLSCKFKIDMKKGSAFEKSGWKSNNLIVSGAWQKMYENINAATAGAVVEFGVFDDVPPEIILWGNE